MLEKLRLQQTWRAYAPLFVAIALYYLCIRLVLNPLETSVKFDVLSVVPALRVTLPPFILLGIFLIYLRLFVLRGPETRGQILRRWLGTTPWLEVFLLRIPLGLAFIVASQRIFIAYKPKLPEIAPFSWDHVFIEWDRILFFGADGWEITHALLPGVNAMIALDYLYVSWFFCLYIAVFYAILQRLESPARMAFLLTFLLTWSIGGNLIATMFSSAGPVYVERVFGDPVFKPMTDHFAAMNQIHEFSFMRTIEKLWEGYADPDVPGLGISAFPSMHLCLAAAIALYAGSFFRWLGGVMWVFTAVIFVGSVHLGWHYAVDGLAGIAIAVLIWFATLRFARWWLSQGDEVVRRVAVET